MTPRALPGSSAPLAASVTPEGTNFSAFAKRADAVELLRFDREDADRPARSIALDPARHRSYQYWHVFVPGVPPGQIHGFRAHGPFEPERGPRFDPTKVLLDPYRLAVAVPDAYERRAACGRGDNAPRFAVPHADENGGRWRRWVDTALKSPEDLLPWEEAPTLEGNGYLVAPRSTVVWIAYAAAGKE